MKTPRITYAMSALPGGTRQLAEEIADRLRDYRLVIDTWDYGRVLRVGIHAPDDPATWLPNSRWAVAVTAEGLREFGPGRLADDAVRVVKETPARHGEQQLEGHETWLPLPLGAG